jgi:mannosyltransferase
MTEEQMKTAMEKGEKFKIFPKRLIIIDQFRLHPYLLGNLGIMCLAIVLSLLFLGKKSIWLDEAISIAMAKSTWPTLWHVISHGEANMGIYYILLHFWIKIGDSEFVVRSLSLIFAVLTVPTVFALGSRLFSKRIGLLGALLITVNPFFIQWAQGARGYSLVLLFSTLSSLVFVVALQRPSKWLWAAYAITSVIAVYAHVFAGFVLLAQAISLLLMRRKDVPWKGLLVSWIAIAILILPLGFNILTSSTHNLDWLTRPGWKDLVEVFVRFTGEKFLLVLFFILCILTCIKAVRQWFVSKTFRETWRYGLLLALLFVPIVISYCISQVKPIFEDRYLIMCIPPLVLLAGIGISLIRIRFLFIASLVILLILSGIQLQSWYAASGGEDWRGATSYVLSNAEKGDAIIFYSPDVGTAFDYYENRISTLDAFPTVVPYFDRNTYQNVNPVTDIPVGYADGGRLPEPDAALSDRLGGYRDIWLVLSHDQIVNLGRNVQSKIIQNLLQEKYGMPKESKTFPNIRVLMFSLNN